MPVHYIETNSNDPCFNLAFEQYILEHRQADDWLMLWQNANTVVVGLNQNTAEEINERFVREHGVAVVRRMTGGGAVYHDMGNLNYSFITDLGAPEELTISRFTIPVCRALASMGVHAETSGRNDITVDGRKVSGVAQRIYKTRILHHGTLLFDSDPEMVSGALNADPSKFESKSAKSVRARVGNIREALAEDMTLSDFWRRLLDELTSDGLIRETVAPDELARINALADEKYRSWDWVYGRSPEYDFKNKRRFPGGTLEVSLRVKGGIIEDADFRGDFMAVRDCKPAVKALRGVKLERGRVESALRPVDVAAIFGGITAENILDTIF